MPTQVYECPKHGELDYYFSWEDEVTETLPCSECSVDSVHILKAPSGGAHFSRTWNEKANDYRRDPYTQAKAQINQVYNEQRDQGKRPSKITEEGIQVAAREIDKDNKGLSKKRDPVREQVKQARQASK